MRNPGYEVLSIGRLDLSPDDHPDTYTGDVTGFHKIGEQYDQLQLYAETRTGQPVELCTLDCEELFSLILEAKKGEVVTKEDMPAGCQDFADVKSALHDALELLQEVHRVHIDPEDDDELGIYDFLQLHTAKAKK